MDLTELKKRNIAFAMKRAGKPVTYDSYQTFGILLNEPKEILQMSSKAYAVLDVETTLTIQTGSCGTIVSNTNIDVDGITYLIHRPLLLNDGLETKLFLSLAVV
jgi:hypothetical protein